MSKDHSDCDIFGMGWSVDYACSRTGLDEKQIAILAEDFDGAWTQKESLSGRFINCLFKACGARHLPHRQPMPNRDTKKNIDPDIFCPMCLSILDLNDDECVVCGWAFLKHVQRQK